MFPQLICHENKKYDGDTLTYKGYDYLALKALVKKGFIASIGNQIGCGKESGAPYPANFFPSVRDRKLLPSASLPAFLTRWFGRQTCFKSWMTKESSLPSSCTGSAAHRSAR